MNAELNQISSSKRLNCARTINKPDLSEEISFKLKKNKKFIKRAAS